MGAMDEMKKMKEKAQQAAASGKGDKVVDEAADKADQETGNKYSDEIDKGADTVKNKMDDKQS